MMSTALIAGLHYLGAMLLMACLLTEHMLLAPRMETGTLRKLGRIDALYGLLAMAQIGSGLGRIWLEKGSDFYLHSGLFHLKLTLFVALGLMSIYPTLRILAWRRAAASVEALAPAPAEYRRVLMLVRLELTLLLLLPIVASFMARGF
ncbi:DUF2214 family protein [Chitinimonas sp.]|uniref:DUF2214 family protein n=1 Tax=Chitinimonas sp. TaxID=1934313 RepID=UPI002F924390